MKVLKPLPLQTTVAAHKSLHSTASWHPAIVAMCAVLQDADTRHTRHAHLVQSCHVVVQHPQSQVICDIDRTFPADAAGGWRVKKLPWFEAVCASWQAFQWPSVLVVREASICRRQQGLLQQPLVLLVGAALESAHYRLHAYSYSWRRSLSDRRSSQSPTCAHLTARTSTPKRRCDTSGQCKQNVHMTVAATAFRIVWQIGRQSLS